MWIAAGLVASTALFLWGLILGEHEGLGRIFTGGLLMVLFGLIGVSAWWTTSLDFPVNMQRMAVVRETVTNLGCNASEDVLGTALNWNTAMVAAKSWNRRWIADPFYNDGVDSVTLINIPVCK